MRKELQQAHFMLEDCPIHGYRVTKIPIKMNYEINQNFYPNNEGPEIFPSEKIIARSSFRNSNRGNLYFPEQNFENDEPNSYYRPYNNISHYDSNEQYSDNYSFYLSGTSKLKPKVTINNVSYQYKNQNSNNYNNQTRNYNTTSPNYYSNRIIARNEPKRYKIVLKNNNFNYYNENINENRSISNNYNKSEDNFYYHNRNLGRPIHEQRIIRNYFNNQIPLKTEPEENYDNKYRYNKRRNYYLTPNYYKNEEEEDESNFDNKRYYLRRNINNPKIKKINDNVNERRIPPNELYSNRNYIYNDFENREIKNRKINENNYQNYNRTIYDTKEKINSDGKMINYKKIVPFNRTKNKNNEIKEYSQFLKNMMNKRKEEANIREENNTKVIHRENNLNNHKIFISTNKGVSSNIMNKIPKIPKKSEQINKQILENIYKNIRKQKLQNKIKSYKEQKDYSMRLKRSNLNNKNINEETEEKIINKENESQKDKEEKIGKQIEKYYDSKGNCIGGKNIIIKKKFQNNEEKVEREIIKEEYKSNFKNLFKKYVPKKEEEGKFIQEEDKYFPYQLNIGELKKEEDTLKNIEDDENKYRVTFGSKSDNLRFEIDDKDEKQADEQKIEVNSEFDDDNDENNKKKENNDKDNNLIIENVPNNISVEDNNENNRNQNTNKEDKESIKINKEEENHNNKIENNRKEDAI